jgi:hypothetical protein
MFHDLHEYPITQLLYTNPAPLPLCLHPFALAGEVLQEVRREFNLQRAKEAPYDIKYALSDGRTKLKMLQEAIGFTK